MKKIVFNDSRQIEVQSVSEAGGVFHARMILTTAESLKALFGDSFATQKMTYFENQITKGVYENYTEFKYVKEETGGVFEVEMRQTAADDKTRLASLEETIQKVTRGDAALLGMFLEAQSQTLSDEQALQFVAFAPEWKLDTSYTTGARVSYNGVLYKVLQTHTSQAAWTPDVTPSLFAKVLIPVDGETAEWELPDSTNAYMTGDKVAHNGKTYESLVDNNVWEPGATGSETLWKEVETE